MKIYDLNLFHAYVFNTAKGVAGCIGYYPSNYIGVTAFLYTMPAYKQLAFSVSLYYHEIKNKAAPKISRSIFNNDITYEYKVHFTSTGFEGVTYSKSSNNNYLNFEAFQNLDRIIYEKLFIIINDNSFRFSIRSKEV